jgi:hypothetical protein
LCLTPLSTIFQLYHGEPVLVVEEAGVPLLGIYTLKTTSFCFGLQFSLFSGCMLKLLDMVSNNIRVNILTMDILEGKQRVHSTRSRKFTAIENPQPRQQNNQPQPIPLRRSIRIRRRSERFQL